LQKLNHPAKQRSKLARMAYTAAIVAAIHNTPPPMADYTDEPAFSPPPYPYYERQLLPPPPQFTHQNSSNSAAAAAAAAEDPPAYNFYDVERGSLIDVVLAQYARSVSPSVASTRYMMLETGEDDPERWCSDSSGTMKRVFFFCMAVFCGVTWAAFWVCAIGFAIVISFQKVAERLS
jgi:hypothetical protein